MIQAAQSAADELLQAGCTTEHGTITDEDRERANRVGTQVAFHVAANRYESARRAIDAAEHAWNRSIAQKTKSTRPLDASLAETELCVRTLNGLEEIGVYTVGDALECTEAQLLAVPNFGPNVVAEIRRICNDWLGRRPASQFAKGAA